MDCFFLRNLPNSSSNSSRMLIQQGGWRRGRPGSTCTAFFQVFLMQPIAIGVQRDGFCRKQKEKPVWRWKIKRRLSAKRHPPSNDLFTHLKSIQAGTTTHPHWVLATCHILFSDPQPTSITLSWIVHGGVVFIWLDLTVPLWSGRDKMQLDRIIKWSFDDIER